MVGIGKGFKRILAILKDQLEDDERDLTPDRPTYRCSLRWLSALIVHLLPFTVRERDCGGEPIVAMEVCAIALLTRMARDDESVPSSARADSLIAAEHAIHILAWLASGREPSWLSIEESRRTVRKSLEQLTARVANFNRNGNNLDLATVKKVSHAIENIKTMIILNVRDDDLAQPRNEEKKKKKSLLCEKMTLLCTIVSLALALLLLFRATRKEVTSIANPQPQPRNTTKTTPDDLYCINNLTTVYGSQEKYDLAQPLCENCLEERKTVLENTHSDSLSGMKADRAREGKGRLKATGKRQKRGRGRRERRVERENRARKRR